MSSIAADGNHLGKEALPLWPGLHLPSVSPEGEMPSMGNNNAHFKTGVVASLLETKACSPSSSVSNH